MNLFLCKTPMQILRAVQLTYSDKDFSESAICIFKTFDLAESLSQRIVDSKLFKEVHVFENNDFLRGKLDYLRAYRSRNAFNQYVKQKKFEALTIFNSDSFDSFSAYNLMGKRVEVRYVEDAPMLYSYLVPSRKKVGFYELLGLKFPIFDVNKWYFSAPDKMEKTNQAPAFALPPMDKSDVEFVKLVNSIFSYVPDEAVRNADVFIMEESFFNDGLMHENADYLCYKKLQSEFCSLDFAVKLHPRTKENRFKGQFACLSKSDIPWEVYLLNENFDDKIFISMSCTTMISPKLLFGKEYHCMMLYNLLGDYVQYENHKPYYDERWLRMLEELQKLYSDQTRISVPKSWDEVLSTIKTWSI